jgi:hypothetical protein
MSPWSQFTCGSDTLAMRDGSVDPLMKKPHRRAQLLSRLEKTRASIKQAKKVVNTVATVTSSAYKRDLIVDGSSPPPSDDDRDEPVPDEGPSHRADYSPSLE